MRKVFNCVSSTAIEAYYLEANILPFRHIIIAHRLMYYWTILQKSEIELVRQVLETQQLAPVRNDWCLKIDEDLRLCNIQLTEEEITKMKKNKFKKLVIQQVTVIAREYLLTLKGKHSKSAGLSEDYTMMQDYLTSDKLTTEQKQLLFQFRTRTFPCKTNYKTQDEPDLSCSICQEEDTPQHLLHCLRIIDGVDTDGMKYCDIFGLTDQQIKFIKVLQKITVNRKKILNK